MAGEVTHSSSRRNDAILEIAAFCSIKCGYLSVEVNDVDSAKIELIFGAACTNKPLGRGGVKCST